MAAGDQRAIQHAVALLRGLELERLEFPAAWQLRDGRESRSTIGARTVRLSLSSGYCLPGRITFRSLFLTMRTRFQSV